MSRAFSRSQHIRKPAVHSEAGIVVSQNRIASEIGVNILRQGGNAVDAAVATSFALGVVEPWMSGIGGGGYMIVQHQNETRAKVIDFGMCSPIQLNIADYPVVGGQANDLFPWPNVKNNANIFGACAVAIPGLVAGMGMAHETFGSKVWADLLSPAIAEAHEGLLVDWYSQLIIANASNKLSNFIGSKGTFLDDEGFPKSSAWTALSQTRCNQSNLAKTLTHIANHGSKSFYEGALAEKIITELNAEGGCQCQADFSQYQAQIYDASVYSYRDHYVYGTPNMTAGPTLQHVLKRLNSWVPSDEIPDADAYKIYDSNIRFANAERYNQMGDNVPKTASGCTTHFNVIDRDGNMVAVTQTLLSMFGSHLVLPTTGILMNNGIMWFDPAPDKPNSIGPNKRCLSNMMPTILRHHDGRSIALGAAGGRKILPAIVQLVSFLLDYDMDIETAMHTPRIDCSLDNVTIIDYNLLPEIRQTLNSTMTSCIEAPRTTYPFNFACPCLAELSSSGTSAAAEVMSPWADAVAEVPIT